MKAELMIFLPVPTCFPMKVAYISTYLPRECGIATFNQNVVRAIALNLARQGQTGPESGFGVALND